MQSELLFKVISGDHEYEIYTDGAIKGFDSNAIVVNFYPQLLRSEKASALPTNNAVPERLGRSHLTPA